MKDRLLELAQGKRRFLSDKELAERDFEGFFTWLRERGVGNPYYYYPKEAWALWRFQRDYGAYVQEQQTKAQADQQREQLRLEILNALKDPLLAKTIILSIVPALPQPAQDEIRTLLTPPPLPDEPPADVRSDLEKVADVLPAGVLPVTRDRDDVEPQPGRRFA